MPSKQAPAPSPRSAILAKIGEAQGSFRSETVEVPEWEMTVEIRELTASEFDSYSASLLRIEHGGKTRRLDISNHTAELLVRCIRVDGERVFRDADAQELGRAPRAVLDRLYAVAARVTGVDQPSDLEAGKNG